jgi:catechol 2,3-dioxygenase
MYVQTLGHVVLKVRSLERSEQFYAGVLGLTVCGRLSDPVPMTFFTLGNHHDFAVIEVGNEASRPGPEVTGLAHVAFKIGDSLDELQAAKVQLRRSGIDIAYKMDHTITKSLFIHDPDGNEVELYIDASDQWRTNFQSGRSAQLVDV